LSHRCSVWIFDTLHMREWRFSFAICDH
jgi:hypothetical protein